MGQPAPIQPPEVPPCPSDRGGREGARTETQAGEAGEGPAGSAGGWESREIPRWGGGHTGGQGTDGRVRHPTRL